MDNNQSEEHSKEYAFLKCEIIQYIHVSSNLIQKFIQDGQIMTASFIIGRFTIIYHITQGSMNTMEPNKQW